jgi:subtilisin family serine protease
MKRRPLGIKRPHRSTAAVAIAFGLASALTVAIPAQAAPNAAPLQTVVFQTTSSTVAAESVVAAMSKSAPVAAPQHRYILHVPSDQVASLLARLHADRRVVYASVAQPVHATVTPDDPCYTTGCPASGTSGLVMQQYLETIGAPAAWGITHGDGVTVAVLDTGVDAAHQDLAGKVVAQVPVCGCGPSNGDANGHGSHVTGILAADTNNGIGIASLGWGVKVEMYQVLNANGLGDTTDVATAIYDAVAAHVRVISMSLANFSCAADPSQCGPDPDDAAAVEYALAHNVVVVAAAGNDGLNSPTYPASYPGVLSVAATDDSGGVQPFSQWGMAANIATPGSKIVSTWNDGGYAVLSGTSMSTPQVAAAAALMIAHNPTLTGPQITELLESTARPTSGGNPINGGLLDVPAALAAEAHPPHLFNGYDTAGSDGSVYSFGAAVFLGSLRGHALNRPVVGMALRGNGLGYWLDASDGGVFAFGDSGFYGSTGNIRLNQPVVGMAATPDGRGYWLVAADGGVFAFGDAGFHGSTGNIRLNRPVVGMAATPDGRGYWLVAADGGVFAFGDAGFHGSTGNIRLNKAVVGMAATVDGRGYWLVAADGGVFAFGDAGFHGSTGNLVLQKTMVGMTPTPSGRGYWLAAADGGVFTFGDARFWGSTGGEAIPGAVVGVAS